MGMGTAMEEGAVWTSGRSSWVAVTVVVLGGAGCSAPDWEAICADLQAKAEQCGQVVLVNCGESRFGDCDNEGELADQLEACAESCEALAGCTHLVCEQ